MIKIIKGVYGHVENGNIIPKNSKSEPFSLSPEREEELVSCGVAAYVEKEETSISAKSINDSKDEKEEHKEPQEDTDSEKISDKPEYSEEMKIAELKELADEYGIEVSGLKSKVEIIKSLDEYFESLEDSDGELPPTFDALTLE